MRVILDANVFLSYLAVPREGQTIVQVVRRCLTDLDIQLIVPRELIAEIVNRATDKPYFQERVPPEATAQLIEVLSILGDIPATLQAEVERYSRDHRDDYLVAYGLVCDADYLVTGDQDLLVLDQVQELRIVKPVEFLQILRR